MKYTVLLLLFLAPLILLAQKGKKKNSKEQFPAWFVGGYFGFQNSNVIVHEDQAWNILYDDLLFFQGGSGRTGGIQAGYGFNKNLDILLGLAFDKRSIAQTTHFPIAFCEPATYGAKERAGANRFVTLRSVEVPLDVRYKFYIGKAFSIYPALGGNLAFTTGKRQDVEVYMDNGAVATHEANDKELDNDRPVNIALTAGLGFRHHLTRSFFIKVEPFYKRYFGKEALLTDYSKTSLRSFGIVAGIEYAIRFQH